MPKNVKGRAKFPAANSLLPLAFEHEDVGDCALRRRRAKLESTTAGFELLPDAFMLSELQDACAFILEEKLGKRNFRRRILSAN